jgi:endonuclease I
MNKFIAYLLGIMVCCSILVPAASADVLLSELCDPHVDYLTDRYIEIYNSGPGTVDLTGWRIEAVGNTNDIFTWMLSGSIAPGQALTAGDATTVDAFQIDFPQESWSDNTSTWNGKVGDGARLKNGSGTVVDEAVMPGTVFENSTLVRNENITSASSYYNAVEWTATAVETPSEATPGTHWQPVTQGPTLGSIATVPAAPQPGQTVDVQAVVTDAAATITSVTLNWGTASGSLTNSIVMTAIGGDTYATATPIPAQTAGAMVFYRVTAANDVPDQTLSDELSFGLPYTLTIADVQGTGLASPHVGHDVNVSGVVTADFGSSFVVQDGTGVRSGLWVTGASAPTLGTEVELSGLVQEIDGNTVLTSSQITATTAGVLPTPQVVTTGAADLEDWEAVLVRVENAGCTVTAPSSATWEVSNTGGAVSVLAMGTTPDLVKGTRYTITGPMNGAAASLGIAPRSGTDIVFVGDTAAPAVAGIDPLGTTTIQLTFTETVSAATAENTSNYSLPGVAVTGASRSAGDPEVVTLTVSYLPNGSHVLTIDGVEDLYGNATVNAAVPFTFTGGNIPAGYYDSAAGLIGEELRATLQDIIDNHNSISYTGLWSAYYTTDVKPNGKVWDMYSDVPGGIPPYEYTLGVDQGGTAGTEGTGYNREHSWPSSWYGSSSPMYTDIFMVVPTDNDVNNKRSNYPFGETDAPTWTSLNGCKRGPSSYPGYTGTVFEPIDEYKGDFARAYFYMTTRYYQMDSSWPGSPMVDGAVLKPWAEAMLLEWNASDPVSTKEINRNEEIYAIQHNRNPFIDRPDFVQKVFQPEVTAVPDMPTAAGLVLHQNAPNPFNPSTTISYELNNAGRVDLRVYDLSGRLVRTIYQGAEEAGTHQKHWAGRDQSGRAVGSGVYFYRLQAGSDVETRRMLLAK